MKSIKPGIQAHNYVRLSELGTRLGLSFSSQLALGTKLLALDGIKKKLLVCELENDLTQYYIIELDQIKSISVKKSYRGIKAGELNERRFQDFIKTIQLHFEYVDANDDVLIPVYEADMNDALDVAALETVLKNWQIVLSKLIGAKQQEGIHKQSLVNRED